MIVPLRILAAILFVACFVLMRDSLIRTNNFGVADWLIFFVYAVWSLAIADLLGLLGKK